MGIKISLHSNLNKLRNFFHAQNLPLTDNIFFSLSKFLSSACKYAEEDNKIKPCLIIGTNLTKEEFFLEEIIQGKIIIFAEDCIDSTNLEKRLKSYLPFCSDNWRVFVDIYDSKVIYGIMKTFTGPSGLDMQELITAEKTDPYYVLIDVISDFEIILKGSVSECTIDLRFYTTEQIKGNSLEEFCDDISKDCDTLNSQARIAKLKTLRQFSQQIHGCICLVIKHSHQLPDDILKDGTFLSKPIDSINLLSGYLGEDRKSEFPITTYEQYLSLENIFIRMLNIDGITVIDTKGRLRAFNVFVKPDIQEDTKFSGGARKRAAVYLQKQTDSDYVGVYFQSQDGMNSYSRINANE